MYGAWSRVGWCVRTVLPQPFASAIGDQTAIAMIFVSVGIGSKCALSDGKLSDGAAAFGPDSAVPARLE
jgi:hypothetical protein